MVTLKERPFWLEGQEGAISKPEFEDDYATVKLSDCTVSFKLDQHCIEKGEIATLEFNNGCIFVGELHVHGRDIFLNAKDNQWRLYKITEEFKFPENFTKKDFQDMSVFCYKCFLMSQFPHLSEKFYDYFKKEKPTKEQLMNLGKDDYLKMGLNETQYEQMSEWIKYKVDKLSN